MGEDLYAPILGLQFLAARKYTNSTWYDTSDIVGAKSEDVRRYFYDSGAPLTYVEVHGFTNGRFRGSGETQAVDIYAVIA